MKVFALSVALWTTTACGFDGRDFDVGPTRVIIHPGAALDDIENWLVSLGLALGDRYDSRTVHGVLDTTVTVYPADAEFPQGPCYGGLYAPETGTIKIRALRRTQECEYVATTTTAETGLSHEFIQHRLPHVMYDDQNKEHRTPFVTLENEIRADIEHYME